MFYWSPQKKITTLRLSVLLYWGLTHAELDLEIFVFFDTLVGSLDKDKIIATAKLGEIWLE